LKSAVRTPVHLWIVAVLSAAWYIYWAFDYVMIQFHNVDYLAGFTSEQRVYFDNFPLWKQAAWACGVWGALAGSVLLSIRSRFAVWAFALSLIGLCVATLYHFIPQPLPQPEWEIDTVTIGSNLADWLIAVFLFVYATRMRARGVLN
jgi:hypothetical protein